VKPIETDANKLKQVLINLIDNALKFTERGKISVGISVSPVDFQPTRIDVSDTGRGIPPDRLDDIFEPFLQLPSEATQPGGTGLGLSICRSLCDLLGFRLEVQSKPGRGSTFSIVLPEAQGDLSLWERVG